jgi:hypothetical protein
MKKKILVVLITILLDGVLYDEQGRSEKVYFMPYYIFSSNLSKNMTLINYDKSKLYEKLRFVVNDVLENEGYLVDLSLREQKLSIKKIERSI